MLSAWMGVSDDRYGDLGKASCSTITWRIVLHSWVCNSNSPPRLDKIFGPGNGMIEVYSKFIQIRTWNRVVPKEVINGLYLPGLAVPLDVRLCIGLHRVVGAGAASVRSCVSR